METSRRELNTNGFSSEAVVRLAIVGTREPSISYSQVKEDIDRFLNGAPAVVVTGGAKGIDTYGMWYAREKHLPLDIYWPLWDTLGRRAGFVRNQDIVTNADIVIAYPGIGGAGTQLTCKIALDTNTPLIEILIPRRSA